MRTLFLLFFSLTPLLALMSITPVDIGDTPGYSAKIKATFVTKRGNTEKDEYSGGLKAQYDNNESALIWSEVEYQYAKTQEVKNENQLTMHTRYLHTLYSNDLVAEMFGQIETDEFQAIEAKYLSGGGLRWRFFNSKFWGNGYVGGGAFYEDVTFSNGDPREQQGRFNSYLAYKKKLPNKAVFSLIAYYQPLAKDSGDFITLLSAQLDTPLLERLSISFKITYNRDAEPPSGIREEDVVSTTALKLAF